MGGNPLDYSQGSLGTLVTMVLICLFIILI